MATKSNIVKGIGTLKALLERSIPPFPPFPEIGRDRFLDGYNRGFIEGMAAARGGR
jgi:hypothetical protein